VDATSQASKASEINPFHRIEAPSSQYGSCTTKEAATSAIEIDGSLETFPRWVSLLDTLVESSNPRPQKATSKP